MTRLDEPPRGDDRPAERGWRRADRGHRHAYGPPWAWHGGPPPWAEGRGWVGRPARLWPSARRRRPFGCLLGLVAVAIPVAFVSIAIVALWVVGRIIGLAWGGVGAGGEVVPRAGLVVLALAFIAVVLVVRNVGDLGTTLDELAEAADRVEAGDYTVRVRQPERGPRRLVDLVRGFNTMAARLEADEAQRRSLLADVSHELRTPLAVVQGTLEAIVDGIYPADAAHLEPLVEETRVLGRLAGDLRTVALADAGTLALHREPTDLGVLLADVAASFRAAAADARVELSTEVDDALPLVDVDPVRMREVLDNVVANGLRHTPPGGRVGIAADAAGDGLEIAVRDTGPGVDPGLLPHIFERFAKDPSSRGSGLGLAIARGLVEAHGGTIGAESRPGAGTTIRIRLPATGADAPGIATEL